MSHIGAVTVRSLDSGEVLRVVPREVPSAVARAVWARDGLCCRYCGFWSNSDATKFELDHVYPRSLGGEHTPENLVVACRRCNQLKSDELGWKPLTGAEARNMRRTRKWAIENGRKWTWRPPTKVRP